MIFADTGALYALLVEGDDKHEAAVAWWFSEERAGPCVTTDYVLAELLNLMNARGKKQRARAVAEDLRTGRLADMARVSEVDFNAAWSVYVDRHDKPWSFTDCTSYVVMQRLGIGTAFAFDADFRQFGTVTVVP